MSSVQEIMAAVQRKLDDTEITNLRQTAMINRFITQLKLHEESMVVLQRKIDDKEMINLRQTAMIHHFISQLRSYEKK